MGRFLAPEGRRGDAIAAKSLLAPVAEGALRVDAITGIPEVLRELGLDPRRALAEAGLDASIFDDPRNAIPIAKLGRLLRLAMRRSGCAHVGLLIGRRSGLASLGLVGQLVRHSPDVGTALRNLTAHLHLRDGGAVAPLWVAGDDATLGYEIYQRNVEAADQICDAAITIGVNVLRSLCGAGFRPRRVLFAHEAPADPQLYRRVLGAPLHFDAERTAIVLPAKLLRQPTRGASPARYRELLRRIEALESRAGGDLVVVLRRLLRATLLRGRGSVNEMADRLGLHRRTLNRRLAARGTSLHRLVEDGRFEIARQLVVHSQMPLTEIAAALGYNDQSAFTRAFRRWTGNAPSAWRSAHASLR